MKSCLRFSALLVAATAFAACSVENATVEDAPMMPEPDGDSGRGSDVDDPGDSSGETPDDEGIGQPLDWDPAGDIETCNVDVLTPASVYVRRVKNLMTGDAPTEDELQAVLADPSALKGLVDGWFDTPQFRAKLQTFMAKTLQQIEGNRFEFGSQALGNDNLGNWDAPDALFDNLGESFPRTVMDIIERDRPFSEIASTRQWMMTTGMISFLLATENGAPRMRFYHDTFSEDGVTFNADTPYRVQFNNLTFYSSTPLNSCSDPYSANQTQSERNLYRLFTTGQTRGMCDEDITMDAVFQESDFQDWRLVEMVELGEDEQQPSMFDAPSLRGLDQIALRSSRTGY
ncbi:MAG: hypothetical protein AAFQ82_28160, partial [Myxococcota bacterium]